MDAMQVSGLVKRYGKFEALGGVDLHVPEGCVFGLVGPNGAGKTTLIKALVGALRPTQGKVSVTGLDPLKHRSQLRQRIGYMPQSSALYEDLSARDNVAFFGAAHRVPNLRKRVDEVLEFADLSTRARDSVHTFSGGMRRRVSLACALVHQPRVLFLDEPTAAVDPQLRSRFWHTFRELAGEGVTLFISTHLMDEAILCDRISILRSGAVIASDTPRKILERGKTRLVVGINGKQEASIISGQPGDLAAALRRYGIFQDVASVSVESDSLEKVVLSIIGEEEK